jgi:hypothetical protein
MVQFNILSGKQAGSMILARRFPFHVGRDAGSDMLLEEQGVWARHLEIQLRADDRFWAVQSSEALVVVDGQKAREVELRNGALIEIGSVKLRFSLAEKPQRNQSLREDLTWVALAALVLLQIGVIYFLLG